MEWQKYDKKPNNKKHTKTNETNTQPKPIPKPNTNTKKKELTSLQITPENNNPLLKQRNTTRTIPISKNSRRMLKKKQRKFNINYKPT